MKLGLMKRLLPNALRVYLGSQRDRLRKLHANYLVSRRPRRGNKPHGLPGELVVSLTSYPIRFRTLHKTIRSLLGQDIRADRVILWLADGDEQYLPDDVRELQQLGLEIRNCADFRSYKKIIPALEAFPE